MAFCTNCGSPVEGAFCAKCGAKMGAPNAPGTPPPQAPPAAPPVVMAPAPAQAPKKGRFVFWALGGCLGLIAIAAILFFLAGSYITHKLGFDSGLLEKKPELAVAKMLVSANPDLEVLSIDEDRGIIKVREKKTGKTLTVDLEDAKNGKIAFLDDQNKRVEIRTSGEGDNATVEIQSSEDTVRMGANGAGQLPSWLPAYPGAEAAGSFGFSAESGKSGSCAFKSNDSVETVAGFYEKALKNAGFEVQKNLTTTNGEEPIIQLSASDENTQRTAHVTAARAKGSTTINLVFENK